MIGETPVTFGLAKLLEWSDRPAVKCVFHSRFSS
jgi:hypothetical protein